MSTDFASSRVFPDPLYKLRVDCEREIDFDFFDDAPSVPATAPWSRGSHDSRTKLKDADADGVLDAECRVDGNIPSPMLVGGPTPADSGNSCGSSGLSSSISLTPSLHDDCRPTQRRLIPVEDAEKEAEDDGEMSLGHADDDVVVGPAGSSAQHRSSKDTGQAAAMTPPPPPPPPQDRPAPRHPAQVRQPGMRATPSPHVQQGEGDADSASGVVLVGSVDGALVDFTSSDGVLDDGTLNDDGDPPRSSTTTPNRTAPSSPSSSEELDDSDASGVGNAGKDSEVEEVAEEGMSFGIQELSLTVSTKPHRAVSSMTMSSMTAVSSINRRDSAGDSDPEDAYTMEAIKRALRRARPPSSTGSLPVMATAGRSGRPRRLNMSFSNDDARRIQRDNELLLRRIVSQRARQPVFGPVKPPANHAAGGRLSPALPAPPLAHRCSHAVNRARRGKDIERDNQILLKKIQSVKRSPSQLSVSRSSSSMSGRYSYC